MSREELKEIITRVIRKLGTEPADGAPLPACIFGDEPDPCDTTTRYSVDEEA